MCVYPYCPDAYIENTTGYMAEHALVAVNGDNEGMYKWVPEHGYLYAYIDDYDDDGLMDGIYFKGMLYNTGFNAPGDINNTLYIDFAANNPVSFDSCALHGGTGSMNCPKCELGLCDSGAPYENYTYFTNVTGMVFGDDLSKITQVPLPGNICRINVKGLPLPQLGYYGGNAKNYKYGFSVWFNCDGGVEAGETEVHVADINLDIKPCPYYGYGYEGEGEKEEDFGGIDRR